jgi:hypothetical protein
MRDHTHYLYTQEEASSDSESAAEDFFSSRHSSVTSLGSTEQSTHVMSPTHTVKSHTDVAGVSRGIPQRCYSTSCLMEGVEKPSYSNLRRRCHSLSKQKGGVAKEVSKQKFLSKLEVSWHAIMYHGVHAWSS